MVSQNNRKLETTEEAKKTVKIKQGSFSLDITVRVDVKQELKDMIDVMAKAKEWAETELANFKK